jgi:uncharacterized coiled-coil DUF342 family protein
MLDELEREHAKLEHLADKARQLRSSNAHLAQEVQQLPMLQQSAAELTEEVARMDEVKNKVRMLQVRHAG